MPKRLLQSDQAFALLHHARSATPFSSRDGEPCASVPNNLDGRRVLPIRSADFRDWLTNNYYSEYESAPSLEALRAALRTLEARARFGDSPAQQVARRLSFEGDPFTPSKIILDLANPRGDTLVITSQGWCIRNNLQHPFRHSPAMLSLPRPAPTSPNPQSLIPLLDLFHLSPSDRTRVLTWLITALRPIGPYPILVIQGPAASGKSLLARALRALIDPSAAPLRRLPARDRDLLQFALRNWILAFDNVNHVAPRISEALCAISSADAIEISQPDFREPLVFQLARPAILATPNDEAPTSWTPPRALSNRTLTVRLAPLAHPRPEAELCSAIESLQSSILAALAAAVSMALHNIRDIDLGNVARFPDTAAWAAAAAPALGLEPSAIVDALASPDSLWTGSDPLRDALYTFLAASPTWTGDATTLLEQLRASAPYLSLPATAKGLSQALARIPGLRVTRAKGPQGHRTLSIARISSTKKGTA